MLHASVLCLTLLSMGLAAGQVPPAAAPVDESSPQLQAVARAAFSAADFRYTFPPVPSTPQSQLGTVRGLFGDATPALGTLPSSGLGQTLISLTACGVYTPHNHPRANEILYVASGTVNIGFHEENNGTTSTGEKYGGRVLNTTVPAGSSFIIPQGLIHWISNPGCTDSALIGSYDNRDPGVITIVQQFFSLPINVIAAATGLDSISINLVQQRLAQQGIVALDEACVAVCGAALPPGQLGAAPAIPPTSAAAAAPVTG